MRSVQYVAGWLLIVAASLAAWFVIAWVVALIVGAAL